MKLKTLKEKIKVHKKKSVAIAIVAFTIMVLATSAIAHNMLVVAATGNIDNLKWNLHLKPNMPEIEIAQIMHEMTHQKVVSEDDQKWGAIPMCNDTIMQVYNYIWKSNYPKEDKDYYLAILDKWKQGDFSNVVSDHNEIWTEEGGTVGYAVGRATPQQEAQFVLVHFGLHWPTFHTLPL
ncbi:DUF6241 domain-containing protein [Neobacillus sp. BF23-41]|uniref:DUF6241 domain-containing protein n=1 Tax=Neobacillus sp. BF23-41 TaxID=3240280 RepID=UPI0034E612C2